MNIKRQQERNLAYSKIADKYKDLFIDELSNKPIDRKLYDIFLDRTLNKGKVLEIGCGPGEISNYLWKKGLDITGIDYSDEMIRSAKEYNNSIEYCVGNVFNLEYESNSITGIVAPYLIVNFNSDEVLDAFKEIYRTLTKGGCFLVSFHVGNNGTRVFNDFLVKNNRISFTFFRVKTIKSLLVKVGFEITEVIVKEPYVGEITMRAFIFCIK
jgi:ubiquinone/menaquinone biosynthesis C-methylase UbiE